MKGRTVARNNKAKSPLLKKRQMKAGNTTGAPSNLPKEIYDSASDFGVFMALIGLISALFFGLIMIIVALYLIFNKGQHSEQIEAEVVDSKCNMLKDSKNNIYKQCETQIKYTIDDKEYLNTISTQKIQANGSTVSVVYDPKNPSDVLFKTGWRRRLGYILLVIAIVSIIAAGIRYYIVRNYKIAAAASGFGEGAALVAAPFQSSSSPSFIDTSIPTDEVLTLVPEVPTE